jgi:hypothetical protein
VLVIILLFPVENILTEVQIFEKKITFHPRKIY